MTVCLREGKREEGREDYRKTEAACLQENDKYSMTFHPKIPDYFRQQIRLKHTHTHTLPTQEISSITTPNSRESCPVTNTCQGYTAGYIVDQLALL